jgi:hypothetical protein
MKKMDREFEVVPLTVVLEKARILHDESPIVETFQARCTPSAKTPGKASPPNIRRDEAK